MPYRTDSERERANWLTLCEAIAQICLVDRCDEDHAQRQLRAFLSDKVLPLRWKAERDDKSPPFGQSGVLIPTDDPPQGQLWLDAKIQWTTDSVCDEWGEYKNGQLRVLLIPRQSIDSQWPIRSKVSKQSNASSGGRPTAREHVHRTLNEMEKVHYDMRQPQKSLAVEVAKRNGKALGDSLWSERAIIGHVSKWLAKKN